MKLCSAMAMGKRSTASVALSWSTKPENRWFFTKCIGTSMDDRQLEFRILSFTGRAHGLCFSNPQPNPQFEWSCETYAAFGSPRMLVSCCKSISRSAVTAEASVVGMTQGCGLIGGCTAKTGMIPLEVQRCELVRVQKTDDSRTSIPAVWDAWNSASCEASFLQDF